MLTMKLNKMQSTLARSFIKALFNKGRANRFRANHQGTNCLIRKILAQCYS